MLLQLFILPHYTDVTPSTLGQEYHT